MRQLALVVNHRKRVRLLKWGAVTGRLRKSTMGPMDAWLAKDSVEHAATQAAQSLVSRPKAVLNQVRVCIHCVCVCVVRACCACELCVSCVCACRAVHGVCVVCIVLVMCAHICTCVRVCTCVCVHVHVHVTRVCARI